MSEEIIIKVIEDMQRKKDMVGYCDYVLDSEKAQHLLNYITNLQQENERLKGKIKEQNLLLIEFQDMEQKVDIYKSRFEKVIEYIKKLQENDDIEIIEEKKIPEKLNLDKDELLKNVIITAQDYVIEGKINEIIDYLKSKGECQ